MEVKKIIDLFCKKYKIKHYNGAIAQLEARLTGSQKVTGSTPVSSKLKQEDK